MIRSQPQRRPGTDGDNRRFRHLQAQRFPSFTTVVGCAILLPMGTWDDGLFDNDSALDTLADLVESVPLDRTPAHLAAGVGLRLWVQPSSLTVHPEMYRALLGKHAAWVDRFPADVRACLKEIEADPEAAAQMRGTRPEVIRAVVGEYCDGPMNRTLLRCEGANEVLEELAAVCRARLNDFAGTPTADLYEVAGDLAALGLLVVLTQVGVACSATGVKRWKAAFARVVRKNRDESAFWDGYARRVRAGFRLLSREAI